MCELLGLSSLKETTINLSLSILAQRGENPNLHGDGWGIAFHEGNDVRLIKDAGPAKDSEWVEFVKGQDIHAHDIIAHIRKSTVGKVNYSNTHPFIRELRGTVHSFAHNGTLAGLTEDPDLRLGNFRPIGDTDSEYAFCLLLERLIPLWTRGTIPPLQERLKVLREFSDELRKKGPLNFLYSDGDAFFAHGDIRLDPITEKLIWPGLYLHEAVGDQHHHVTEDHSESGLRLDCEDDKVILFASVPLNDKKWVPLERGEIVAVSRGSIVTASQPS